LEGGKGVIWTANTTNTFLSSQTFSVGINIKSFSKCMNLFHYLDYAAGDLVLCACSQLMLTTEVANAFISEFTIVQAIEFKLWDPGGCFIVHVEVVAIILHHYLDFNLEVKVDFNGGSNVMIQNNI
jgi:hypothetical protein